MRNTFRVRFPIRLLPSSLSRAVAVHEKATPIEMSSPRYFMCGLSEPEGDGEHDAYGNGASADFSGGPARHGADHAEGLAVEGLVLGAADDLGVGDFSVCSDDETAQHAALHAVAVGVIRVLACLADEVDQPVLAAGKLGLHVDPVELVHFLAVRLLGEWIDARDVSHLRPYRHRGE